MKAVIVSLLLILLTGCQTTKTVTQYEYKEIVKRPPATVLTQCTLPFNAPPKTYGEAVLRDAVWLNAFRLCACKIDKSRVFYGYDAPNSSCDKLKEKDKSLIEPKAEP